MKHKKALIIVGGILFFLAALTFYLNRVIFPQLIKKIAIERLEGTLKRKVEIGSIRLNWFRGFIIDKIKIYEKDSNDTVFAQADQVSFGIIVFPGAKHWRINIPFINVQSPSVRLIRTAPDTWNFNDLSAAAAPTAPPPVNSAAVNASPAQAQVPKSPSFDLAWGGITVSDGQLMVNDASPGRQWSELFNNISLKLSLSYKGIHYDFTAVIPQKNGFIGATVDYQPMNQNTQAKIRLKNIDTASYLALINLPDVHLDSGIIKDIDLTINHSTEKTSAQGDVVMQDLDIQNQDQSFKGDFQIHGLDAQYANGDITARGQMTLNNVQTSLPGLSAGGSVEAHIGDFKLSKAEMSFMGSVRGKNVFLKLKDRRLQVEDTSLDGLKIKKDENGIQSSGSMVSQNLSIQWPNQRLQGDIALRDINLRLKDEKNIVFQGGIEADHFSTSITDKGKSIQVSAASIKTDKLTFNMDNGMINVNTTLRTSQGRLALDDGKIIEADPQMELNLQMPMNDAQQLVYKGSITLSDGRLRGFVPVIGTAENVDLDADFQNDALTINAMSANVLDTNVRLSGKVKNFKHPQLDINGETAELNLADLKAFSPLFKQYGLNLDGVASVKVQFTGPLETPSAATILAKASFKNVNASSDKLHQRLDNISGSIEATPDSLKWHGFTGVYQGRVYTLSGSLKDFKNPRILTTIDGADFSFKADLIKNDTLITINSLKGKYLNAAVDCKGDITLTPAAGAVFNIDSHASLLLEDLIKTLPEAQRKNILPLNPSGILSMTASIKGAGTDWKNYHISGQLASPSVSLMGYHMTDLKTNIEQADGKIKNLTFDGKLYSGSVHAVGSLDLSARNMPYDLALNIDSADLHQWKVDSPFKMNEMNGKFFLTTVAHGNIADLKNSLKATGSLAIRDGYLAQFNLFKGLLGVLNDALRLGQVEITDVDGNFTIGDQKINTDNLRLKGPTIVLLTKGWVNFDLLCDLNVSVDLSSGVVPAIAHDVLNTLNIRIYDKISDPKFKKKISVPQVINTLLKNLLQ